MATVKFYLKRPASNQASLIYLVYHFNGNRLKFSTGVKVSPKQWDSKNQRVRKNYEGSNNKNMFLQTLVNRIEGIYLNASSKGIEITPDFLKGELLKSLNKHSAQKSFFDCLNEYYLISQGKLSKNYLKRVITLRNHLKDFEATQKINLTFGKIDLAFYDLFTTYLMKEKKQLNNTIGCNISTLKTFLAWAASRGYNQNMKFKEREFKTYKEESDIIYLTENELMNLYSLDLSNNNRLDKVRDTFCFGCFTGLRFSDIAKIKPENISEEELSLVTTKTRTSITIPLNDFAKEILIKNNFKLPVISHQKTNDYLKELGQRAGIDEQVIITKYRGAEAIEFREPKYNFITTHTARRTFCTLSLEKGMRAETVMEITGHRSYKMFKKYIKITNKVKSLEMRRVWSLPKELKRAV